MFVLLKYTNELLFQTLYSLSSLLIRGSRFTQQFTLYAPFWVASYFIFDMAKDPAFLFYPGDYLGETMGLTFEEKGAHMELLMLQFNRGHMTPHMIGHTVGQLWVNIKHNFIEDAEGLFYHERLEEEKLRRQKFTASRRNNVKGKNQHSKKVGHMTSHMETETETSIVINKDNISELTNCFSMKENICKLIGKSLAKVDALLSLFIIEQEAKGDLNRSLGDLRRHFTSWAKLNHDQVIKTGYKPKEFKDIPKVDAEVEYQKFLDLAKEKGLKLHKSAT